MDLKLADALSRDLMKEEEKFMEDDIWADVNAVFDCYLPVSKNKLQAIKEETRKSEQLKTVKEFIMRGWPDFHKSLPEDIKGFLRMRDCLTIKETFCCVEGV